jgi:ribonuclease HI
MIIYCDGGSRGNPGPSASAFVATVDDEVVYREGKYLGIETNNVAEYNAVIMALTWVKDSSPTGEVIINLDSQLIERQINGQYKVKDAKLIKLHDKVKSILNELKTKPKFIWNYRNGNELADDLVNEELDAHKGSAK